MSNRGGHSRKHSGSNKHTHRHSGNHGGPGKHHPGHHRPPIVPIPVKVTPGGTGGHRPHRGGGKHHHRRGFSPGESVAACAALALASSAEAAGFTVNNASVLELYYRTAGYDSQGATIASTIEAAAEYGLGGVRPVNFEPCTLRPGAIVGTQYLGNPHTVFLDSSGVWTWREWHPFCCGHLNEPDEAWMVTW